MVLQDQGDCVSVKACLFVCSFFSVSFPCADVFNRDGQALGKHVLQPEDPAFGVIKACRVAPR